MVDEALEAVVASMQVVNHEYRCRDQHASAPKQNSSSPRPQARSASREVVEVGGGSTDR